MAAVGVLVNANAVSLARDAGLLQRLRTLVDGRPLAITRDPAEVARAIRLFRQQDVELICIHGGDGTALSVLTAAIEVYGEALPRIALLRGGTINTLAKYLKIRGRPDDLLRRFLQDRQQARKLAVIRVNDCYGLTFGAALMGRFYHEYNQMERIDPPTVAGYVARVVLSAVFNTERACRLLAPVPATITVDGEVLPLDACTVIVASCMEGHGFGVRPTYRGSSLPGHFQLLASAKGQAEIARGYHRLLLGRPFTGDDHFDGMVRQARISFCGPELCMVDGEVFEAEQVDLAIGPTFEFVQ